MRDVVVTMIVIVWIIYAIRTPYIGVLLWSWLSYMNPHRLCYGFAHNAPFAQASAIALMVSLVFAKKTERKKIPITPTTLVWGTFILFMGVTTFFAFFPEDALEEFTRVIKIQLIVFLTLILITDLDKLNKLLWTVVFSIGYFSVKGGLFTLLTGGQYKVWGPASSYIADNNALAVGVLMVIPLMVYFFQTSEKKWVKRALLISIIFSLVTVVGSQSRGAFVAILAVGFFYWTKSKSKAVTAVSFVILATALLAFMPDKWMDRMKTIGEYEQDGSAMGRINAWRYAFNVANNHLLGFGFESWSPVTFAMHAPVIEDVHAAHSIYFSVLADHGWIGLFLYLTIYFLTWRKITFLIKRTKHEPESEKINVLAKMLQVSLLAYLVGGAFLSLAYYDLPWHLVSFVVILTRIYEENFSPAPEKNYRQKFLQVTKEQAFKL